MMFTGHNRQQIYKSVNSEIAQLEESVASGAGKEWGGGPRRNVKDD